MARAQVSHAALVCRSKDAMISGLTFFSHGPFQFTQPGVSFSALDESTGSTTNVLVTLRR